MDKEIIDEVERMKAEFEAESKTNEAHAESDLKLVNPEFTPKELMVFRQAYDKLETMILPQLENDLAFNKWLLEQLAKKLNI